MKKILMFLLLIPIMLLSSCGNKITKDKFDKAFDSNSFNNVEFVVETKFDRHTIKKANNVVYYSSEVFIRDYHKEEYYFEQANEIGYRYMYDKNNEKWYKIEANLENVTLFNVLNYFDQNLHSNYRINLSSVKENFDFIKYNSSSKEYNCEFNPEYQYTTKLKLKFKNSKISTIECKLYDCGSLDHSGIYTFSNYGKVSVTLPEAELREVIL